MINITPTFFHEYYNTTRGIPGEIDTSIFYPVITMAGKKATATYVDKKYFPNPVFPVELYEYRRGSNIKLSIDGVIDQNLQKVTFKRRFTEIRQMEPKI